MTTQEFGELKAGDSLTWNSQTYTFYKHVQPTIGLFRRNADLAPSLQASSLLSLEGENLVDRTTEVIMPVNEIILTKLEMRKVAA